MEWFTIENLAYATVLWISFVVVLFVLRKVIPGRVYRGRVLADGTAKSYQLNGIYLFLIVALVIGLAYAAGAFSLASVHRLFWPLFIAANLFAIAHTGQLFVGGRRRRRAQGVELKDPLHDLWFGPELNPEFWGVDLKLFAYVPSLLALWILNLSFAAVQLDELGHLTTRMLLYQSFFTIYIANYFHFEYGMLHTWDVIAENFGWMLVWGDYVLVPFFYSIGGWYVLRTTDPMQVYEVVGLIVLFAVGMTLFRGANQQKHRFKEDPQAKIWGKTAKTLDGKLLISGFWGIGRKLNYTGELLVYLSFALCTGFDSVVPYLLPMWLLGLFVHRAWRDEQRCREKYGDVWMEYCRRAPFRMFPYIY